MFNLSRCCFHASGSLPLFHSYLSILAIWTREISNMSQLGGHVNVLQLYEALELVQESKTTIFLVLELASGGELFDRIKAECGADEVTARLYFRQLLSGVAYCHERGVCHRTYTPSFFFRALSLAFYIYISSSSTSYSSSILLYIFLSFSR